MEIQEPDGSPNLDDEISDGIEEETKVNMVINGNIPKESMSAPMRQSE
jgi:hypothetical protein